MPGTLGATMLSFWRHPIIFIRRLLLPTCKTCIHHYGERDSIFVIITCGIVALCLFIALMCCATDLVTRIASPEAAMLNDMLQAVRQ